jgi:hypothetical protein
MPVLARRPTRRKREIRRVHSQNRRDVHGAVRRGRRAMCRARASAQVDDAASKYGKAQSLHQLANLIRLHRAPPVLRFVQRCLHRKWLLKPPLISHNMHKFRQHLRRDRHPILSREQFREQAQGICMMHVLYDLDGQEEACIQAMRHTRPSSISLYHSSRVPIVGESCRRLPDSYPAGWVSAPAPLRAVLCG